jgi:dephospho-CoA kinase
LTEAERSHLEADAHRRLAQQMPDEQKAELSDYVLVNDGPLKELEWQVEQLWPLLEQQAMASGRDEGSSPKETRRAGG